MTRAIHRCPHCGAGLSTHSPLVAAVLKAIGQCDRGHIEIGGIRAAVVRAKLNPTDKQLYNAISYLTRRRKILKLGYGQYAGMSS